MHIAIECGQCGTPITVPGDLTGRKIRCRSCGTVLVVPGQDQRPADRPVERAAPPPADDYDEPRPRRRPREGDYRPPRRRRFQERDTRKTWLVAGAIGGGFLLLLIVGGLVYYFAVGGNVLSGDNGRLTTENEQRFNDRFKQGNMTLDDAEQILGPSRLATEGDLRRANAGTPPAIWIHLPSRPGTAKYRWKNGNHWLFATVDDKTKIISSTEGVSKGD
jgi:hypothetical protein